LRLFTIAALIAGHLVKVSVLAAHAVYGSRRWRAERFCRALQPFLKRCFAANKKRLSDFVEQALTVTDHYSEIFQDRANLAGNFRGDDHANHFMSIRSFCILTAGIIVGLLTGIAWTLASIARELHRLSVHFGG
jgi:hypothetical protein